MAQPAEDSNRHYSGAGFHHLDISAEPCTLGLKAKASK
jgi:hypothetical protein